MQNASTPDTCSTNYGWSKWIVVVLGGHSKLRIFLRFQMSIATTLESRQKPHIPIRDCSKTKKNWGQTLNSLKQTRYRRWRLGRGGISLDCSLHRTEKGAMVCRMASGGHLSLGGERWLTRISLLGNGRPPSPPCFIGNTSISPRNTSPWNIRMLTPAGAPAAGAAPPLPPGPPPGAPSGGDRGAAIASGESEEREERGGSVISRPRAQAGAPACPPPASAERRGAAGFWSLGWGE